MPELTDKAVEFLLPSTQPELVLPAGVTAEDLSIRSEGLNNQQRRILRWTASLQGVVERERWDLQRPGFQYATFGFVPISGELELPNGVVHYGGYVFGVALELEATSDNPFQQIESFSVGNATLARVLNWRSMVPHIPPHPTYPSAGTGACYAHSKKRAIAPAADGVLTAAHVVRGVTLGSAVSMSSSSGWAVGDRGSCKIDAALIVLAGCIPAKTTTLGVQYGPLPGMDIWFYGNRTGGIITGKITHTQIHSTYLSDEHPMRVFFDQHGIAGDSGALVRERATGDGVGIYMGSYPIPPVLGGSPVNEGGAQSLSQAKEVLQLDLYV
jgi:hypothetical protein